MQTIFKYISQHGAWAFLFMAAISTSLLGPLNQFSFLYTAALLVLPLNISALRKITNINFLIIFLLAACSASIILADPAAIFKPWQRLVYFILLLLTVSPLVSSKQLDIFRIQAFEWCMNLCVFVGVASFFCYFLGINYMRTIINVSDSFSGSFGGITPQSMLLGPVAGIAANWLLYKILKRYFSQTTFSPLILLMLGTCLCSMLLSSSRGAFLATVITALYVLFMFTKDHIRKAPKIIFVLLLCFTAASPLIGNFADGLQNKQQANMEKGGTLSSRQSLWNERIKEFKSSPIYGVGFSSQKEIRIDIRTLNTGAVEPGTSYGAVFAMTGLLGGIPFLMILASQILKKPSAAFGMHVISPAQVCLVFFGMHMMVEGYVFAAGSPLCALLWLSVGAASAWQNKNITNIACL